MGQADLKSNIIPAMHYRDAFAAIDWLCDVLGFTRHLFVPDGKSGVAHAELTLGNDMIMLGSHRVEAGDSVVAPIAAEYWTQSTYIVAGDIEAFTSARNLRRQTSFPNSKSSTTAAACFPSATPKDNSGISAPTTHGRIKRVAELQSSTHGKLREPLPIIAACRRITKNEESRLGW